MNTYAGISLEMAIAEAQNPGTPLQHLAVVKLRTARRRPAMKWCKRNLGQVPSELSTAWV